MKTIPCISCIEIERVPIQLFDVQSYFNYLYSKLNAYSLAKAKCVTEAVAYTPIIIMYDSSFKPLDPAIN